MAIEVRGLTKRFKNVVAVDDLSLSVAEGTVFAFVGTNGAGKSTTINCLTTLLPLDAGEASVAGFDVARDPDQVRARIGVVFQDSVLDPTLTGRENLRLRARFAGLDRRAADERISDLAELIDVGEFLDRRYKTLSGGQRRRIDVARALLHRPEALFLDEPTAGLDPASRAAVWGTIQQLRRRGEFTVFLTTHYLEETEEADEVCIIDRGRIAASGTPAQLREQHSRSILTVTSADPGALLALADVRGISATRDGDVVVIPVDGATTARALLAAHGDSAVDFEFRHGSMDDVFLAVTGRVGGDGVSETAA
ncbi:ABC transporter ATP-binding protein [Microbacterium ulmi]|uniref:ABC transporter ATP-binding protein n=1 Tax=Microbacterium ulmi TaxID=179095 RepID=A0A7Y2M0I2_9MICO|nr:ABC transporter ATP-binding protein [Microbacterium ulmi]NII70612.1 multidrug/hemolysin transport system ATP-binding protein [Microbacterium ulmi]NNH04147.1 ABC transporter ATP-binding protein [Microbacterium ulmi]